MFSSRKPKSSRRPSSSRSYSESSEQTYLEEEAEYEPVPPPTTFLFRVNSLGVNEDEGSGGVRPRVDENGYWFPPVYGAGFGRQRSGTMFRWNNGVISQATGYAANTGSLGLYRAITMFYCNPFYQFVVAEGDASTRNMLDATVPLDRWYPLHFRYHGALSRLDYAGDQTFLAGSGAEFIRPLGLDSYRNREAGAPDSGGLAGNLAILIGLIAFSCRTRDLDGVLLNDRAWRRYEWRGHGREHGRRDTRGLVVSIFYDPQNEDGSNPGTLQNLEWEMGALLI